MLNLNNHSIIFSGFCNYIGLIFVWGLIFFVVCCYCVFTFVFGSCCRSNALVIFMEFFSLLSSLSDLPTRPKQGMTLLIEYTGLKIEMFFCKCIRILIIIFVIHYVAVWFQDIHRNLPNNFVPNGISYFSHQGELRPDPTHGPGSPRSRLVVIVF